MPGGLKMGDLLDGQYRIVRQISGGGLSSVFEARDLRTDGPVALKMPVPGLEADPVYHARFLKEEAIGLSLDHPSIVRTLPVGQKSRPYLVMELLEGTLLWDRLKGGQPLPVAEVLDLGLRIARALAYLHGRGIVHRDLKPGNIMLCRDGTLKLIDLGLAVSEHHPELPPPLGYPALGTPDYMPPEQVRGKRSDARSDVYSLGAILYEMATGRTPFQGGDSEVVMHARLAGDPVAPSRLNPALPALVEEIILHALAQDPADRYASAADLIRDLEDPGRVAPSGRAARLRVPSAAKMLWLHVRGFAWTFSAIMAFFALAILFALAFGHHR